MKSRALSLRKPQEILLDILQDETSIKALQKLNPQTIYNLVNSLGVEDSGELIAVLSPTQLQKTLDQDVWKPTGCEETFDAERFLVWLEVINELPTPIRVQKIVELGREFITTTFLNYIRVILRDDLALQLFNQEHFENSDHNILKYMNEALDTYEINDYWVLCQYPEAWECVISILEALLSEDTPFFKTIMSKMYQASVELMDDGGGLYEISSLQSQMQSDLNHDRKLRQEEEGFLSAYEAKIFLTHAMRFKCDDIQNYKPDFVSKHYFKHLEVLNMKKQPDFSENSEDTPLSSESLQKISELIESADELNRDTMLLLSPSRNQKTLEVMKLIDEISAQSPEKSDAIKKELNFLANIILMGVTLDGRKPEPHEISQIVIATANLGLEQFQKQSPAKILSDYGLIVFFKAGLSYLRQNLVSWGVLDLIFQMDNLKNKIHQLGLNRFQIEELNSLKVFFQKSLEHGEIQQINDQLDSLIGTLDDVAIDVYKKIIVDYPLMPVFIDPEVKFISSTEQIEKIREHLTP